MLLRFGRKQPAPDVSYTLDTPLLRLSNKDTWTTRDACEGVQIFGAIGSGKTSGSGAALAMAFLREGFGGIVCCAKPDERELWQQYAAATGRSKHLCIVSEEPDPQHGRQWRFNFLDYELNRDGRGAGKTENLVNLIASVSEIAEGRTAQGGGDPFWQLAMRQMLRNAIDLLAIARSSLSIPDLRRLILDAPQTLEQADLDTEAGEKWGAHSFCAEVLAEAEARTGKTPQQSQDFEIARDYWLKEFAGLGDRTRSSIVFTFTSVADMLLHGDMRELFCSDTTIVPEMTYKDGAVIILDLPVQGFGIMGRIAQVGDS